MSAKRKGHSYRMALITHIKDWRLAIDKGKSGNTGKVGLNYSIKNSDFSMYANDH